MTKHSIRLLLTLTLTTAAVTAGWTHATADLRSASLTEARSIGTGPPEMTPFSGDPDPGSAPAPKLIASRDDHWFVRRTPSWLSWASRVWAMWYLRTAW